MREIRLEIVPRPEDGVAIIYEKSEQLGEGPYITGEGEERDENIYVAIVAICLQIIWVTLGMDAIHITKVLVRNHSLSF